MIILPTDNVNRKSIKVDTAKGTPISNEQDWSDGYSQAAQHASLSSKFPRAKPRTQNVSGVYNCHGMVFASRRTMISDPMEIRKILSEDGYKAVKQSDVLPGDVVLYIAESGDVEHSAIAVSIPDPLFSIVHVVSKWGMGPEYFHAMNDGPYTCTRLEFYRVDQ